MDVPAHDKKSPHNVTLRLSLEEARDWLSRDATQKHLGRVLTECQRWTRFGSFGYGITVEESLEISELAMATTAIAYLDGEISLDLVAHHLQNALNTERQRVKRQKVKSGSSTPEQVESLSFVPRVLVQIESREILREVVDRIEPCMEAAILQVSKRDLRLLVQDYGLELEGVVTAGDVPEVRFDKSESHERALRRARERFSAYLESSLAEARAHASEDLWPIYDAALAIVRGKENLLEALTEIRMLLGTQVGRREA